MEGELSIWVRDERSSYSNFLKRLVNINSFTENIEGVNKVQNLLEKEFLSLGLVVERVAMTECGDQLVVRTVSSGNCDVLLMGHADTVHQPDSAYSFYSQEGAKAYGPGVADMKGGLVVLLWALKALNHCGRLADVPLTVIINSDEETASVHSRELIEQHAERARAAVVFEWGRENSALISKRKGVKFFDVVVRGRAAHAGGRHKEGRNAISALARIVADLDSLTDYRRGITLNVGTISGGVSRNVVPELAEASFEVRAPEGRDFTELDRLLNEFCQAHAADGISVTLTERVFVPPMEESEESRHLYECFAQCARRVGFEVSLLQVVLGGGSNANDISACGVPCLDGFGPLGEFAHTDQEYILLDSLEPKILSMAYWLLTEGSKKCS